MQVDGEQDDGRADKHGEQRMEQIREIAVPFRRNILNARFVFCWLGSREYTIDLLYRYVGEYVRVTCTYYRLR